MIINRKGSYITDLPMALRESATKTYTSKGPHIKKNPVSLMSQLWLQNKEGHKNYTTEVEFNMNTIYTVEAEKQAKNNNQQE